VGRGQAIPKGAHKAELLTSGKMILVTSQDNIASGDPEATPLFSSLSPPLWLHPSCFIYLEDKADIPTAGFPSSDTFHESQSTLCFPAELDLGGVGGFLFACFVCLFVCLFVCFETRFSYVAMTVLKLVLWTRLAWNSQRSACLCPPP
jgi:hypothetical protein